MAFCPECGKSAAPEATRCIHCGHDLAASGKGAAARFKGTMMMAAPATAKAAAQPAAAAPAPTPAAQPAAAPAAAQAPAKTGAAKQTMIGTGIGPLSGAKPAAAPAAAPSTRNAAFAQTQHQAAFAAAPTPAAAPVEQLGIAATPMAPRPEPEPEPEPARPQYAAPNAGNYSPGDPLTHDEPMRSPVLRYDDSMPELPRHNPLQDKKMLWIAAGAIGFICLILLVVLFSNMN